MHLACRYVEQVRFGQRRAAFPCLDLLAWLRGGRGGGAAVADVSLRVAEGEEEEQEVGLPVAVEMRRVRPLSLAKPRPLPPPLRGVYTAGVRGVWPRTCP